MTKTKKELLADVEEWRTLKDLPKMEALNFTGDIHILSSIDSDLITKIYRHQILKEMFIENLPAYREFFDSKEEENEALS